MNERLLIRVAFLLWKGAGDEKNQKLHTLILVLVAPLFGVRPFGVHSDIR